MKNTVTKGKKADTQESKQVKVRTTKATLPKIVEKKCWAKYSLHIHICEMYVDNADDNMTIGAFLMNSFITSKCMSLYYMNLRLAMLIVSNTGGTTTEVSAINKSYNYCSWHSRDRDRTTTAVGTVEIEIGQLLQLAQ